MKLLLLRASAPLLAAVTGASQSPAPIVVRPPVLPQAVASLGTAAADGWLYVYGGHVGRAHQHSREHVVGSRRLNLACSSFAAAQTCTIDHRHYALAADGPQLLGWSAAAGWVALVDELAPQLAAARMVSWQERLLFTCVDADRSSLTLHLLDPPQPRRPSASRWF
ncbi:MAG: hypothetical protein AAF628_10725 [Planctomycetota bacterium]